MPRRILITFVLIVVLIFTYFYFRLLGPLRIWPSIFWPFTGLMIVAFLSVLWLPLFFWASESTETRLYENIFERVAHVSMGVLSLLLFLSVSRDLLIPVLAIFGQSALLSNSIASLTISLFAFALAGIGFYLARRGPIIRYVSLTETRTPEALRIVQISDLHVGTWIRKRYVEKVVAQIEKLGPIDFLVLTGDIGDGDPNRHRSDLEPLSKINPRIGKFSVSGNHEGYWDEEEWNRLIRDLGFRVLENEGIEVATPRGPLTVHGVTDSGPNPKRAFANIRPDVFSLFLSHQPKHADSAIKAGVRLQLSGHTHGGQFLPWSLFIGLAHTFAAGLYRVGRTAIYVNSGTGFWGPPFRLGTRSEITVIEFNPQE